MLSENSSTECNYHIYSIHWRVINVKAIGSFCTDKILILAVLWRWLLQRRETEASFVFNNFYLHDAVLCNAFQCQCVDARNAPSHPV